MVSARRRIFPKPHAGQPSRRLATLRFRRVRPGHRASSHPQAHRPPTRWRPFNNVAPSNAPPAPGPQRVGVVTPETLFTHRRRYRASRYRLAGQQGRQAHAHPSTPLADRAFRSAFCVGSPCLRPACTRNRSRSSTPARPSPSRSAIRRAAPTTTTRGCSHATSGKYIPGHPTVVIQNMPGAGSCAPPTISTTSRPRTAPRSAS